MIIKQLKEINDGKNRQEGKLDKKPNNFFLKNGSIVCQKIGLFRG